MKNKFFDIIGLLFLFYISYCFYSIKQELVKLNLQLKELRYELIFVSCKEEENKGCDK